MANATALRTLLVSHYTGDEIIWDRTLSGTERKLVGLPEKRKREASCSVLRRSGGLILHRMVERERATPSNTEGQREPGLRSMMSPGWWKDRNCMGNTFGSFNSVSKKVNTGCSSSIIVSRRRSSQDVVANLPN